MIRLMSFVAALLGLIAFVATIVRRPFGGIADRRNVDVLARRHHLDRATASRLYEAARRDGFGTAWAEVIEGRRPAAASPDAATIPASGSTPASTIPRPGSGKPRTRKLADRPQT